jgi:hypothetical protein
MAISSEHITGFAVGIGVAAAGFYLYKKNQSRVDEWLRQQGIHVAAGGSTDPSAMTLEELVSEKERLEDVIAEREHAMREEEGAAATPTA